MTNEQTQQWQFENDGTDQPGTVEVTPQDPQVVGDENNQDASSAPTPDETTDEEPDFGDGYDDNALEAKESDADFGADEQNAKEQPL
jgi:hypothetical protein